MPHMMWQIVFTCPHCGSRQLLRSKGTYNHVRHVVDLKDFYYLVGEYMDCRACNGTFVSWDQRMLDQLPDGVRSRFPVVLTRKYACDISVVRSRTLGNSLTALRNEVQELHSEEWLQRHISDCERHKRGLEVLNQPIPVYRQADPFTPLPNARWFLAVYIKDVWSRLPILKAAATSVFGSILKIDSTKKICKKLRGNAAGTANWATNVGNERGEIVVSVLTQSEGMNDLQRLANGLMDRYEKAQEPQPILIYTDRECCSQNGPSKYNVLFHKWTNLHVRLDIWHFMRRLANGCVSESHPLYGTFMGQLSNCIFKWMTWPY